MKNLTVFLMIIFSLTLILSQDSPENAEPLNTFEGGIGITWIDGTPHTCLSITPDLSFGKIGVGLNIELLFNNQDGFKFRKTGWDKGAGIFRAIRYIRYGQKYDPVYARIGSIDAATLGYGFIMWYYSNAANYDQRKIGLEFDVDFNRFGFESVVSNLGNKEIYGGRAYYRPLFSSELPVIRNLELGATIVTDLDPTPAFIPTKNDTVDNITEWGLDIGVPVIRKELFATTVYYNFAKIIDFGSGNAVGVKFDISGILNLFNLSAKLEKRFLNEKFIPNYFNTLYELDRSLDVYHGSKILLLDNMGKTEGIFGELTGSIVGKIQLIGNYQKLNAIEHSGIMHLEARMPNLIPNVRLNATYDKTGIETFKDMRTLDHHSVSIVEAGYKIYWFLYLSVRYRWNFIYDEDTGEYKPQERIEPRISFVYEF